MQYFLGYPSFISEKPFDATLFVEIRKRLSLDVMNAINETIVKLMTCFEEKKENANRKSEASTTVAPLEKGDTQPVKKIGQAETEASVTNASLENNDTQAEKVSSQEQAKENGQSELKLAGAVAPCLIVKVWYNFSARMRGVASFIIMYKVLVHRTSSPLMAVA